MPELPAQFPIVELNDIRFVRNGTPILDGISWRIDPGQHWALLGANGSGKTTLLKILTGYEWPTSGTVCVLGQPFGQCDIRELRKTIGWVSSSLEHRIPPRLTASRVVASGIDASIGVYRAYTADEEGAVQSALDEMGVVALSERHYGLLSQGEQQRVIIARALVAKPRLLILDEPCAGLDPAARHHFLSDLAELALRDSSPTVVVVTHHVEEIGAWTKCTLALRNGAVAAQGPTAQVVTSETLSRVFDLPCDVRKVKGVYRVVIGPSANSFD